MKKLYRKGGFLYINNNDSHIVGEINKYYFIIEEIYKKEGNLKKEDAIKNYYISKGFNYTL